jgi:osmoprotectant transport system ATP-binding protein
MDEPFGALDPVTRDRLQTAFREIHRDLGLTTVMVTHDMGEALSMGERVVVMKGGKILRDAAPAEILNDPGHPYVAELMEAPRRQARLVESLVRT